MLVKKRIVSPVELQRTHTETLTQAEMERRCSLHPAALQAQLREAVPDEKVSANQLEHFPGSQMVAHVRERGPRGDAHAPRRGSQKSRLGNAESSFGAQAIAGPEIAPLFSRMVRVVKNSIAHCVLEFDRARCVVGRTRRYVSRELPHICIVAINKLPGR